MDIYLAKTQGFCAGVSLAVDIVEEALQAFGPPLYVYHEIVHNTHIVNAFEKKGVVFVESIEEVPVGSRLIFSAHGVPPSVIEQARLRQLKFVDTTCPLVTKVHNEAIKFSNMRCETILIGHRGHQELIGTSGYVDPKYLHIVEDEADLDALDIDPEADVACITQTTLSVDDTTVMLDKLRANFENLREPPHSDLCFATQNRQDAVKELATTCELIIICGSPNSSNSNRLCEVGRNAGVESVIIDSAAELDVSILEGREKVGVSSGASVPRFIVDELIDRIRRHYPDCHIHTFENPEKHIEFKSPLVKEALS